MALVNGYCTEIELQRSLSRKTGATDPNYALLQDSINQASRIIDKYTGSFFYEKTLSEEIVDIFGRSNSGIYMEKTRRRLFFPAPIISIEISEDDVVLTDETDYYVYSSDGYVDRDGIWSTNRKAISINGNIGHESVPDNVKRWCISIADAISGLSVKSFLDDSGNQIEIIKNSVPKWVWLEMKRASWIIS